MNRICFNDQFYTEDEPILLSTNKSYRYGDGLFETMRLFNNRVPLFQLHTDRLFTGMNQLEYQVPGKLSRETLLNNIQTLATFNNCSESARIRVSVSRGNGGLTSDSDEASYVIECWPTAPAAFNEEGLITDIFPLGKKSIDTYSPLKSSSYLLCSEASRWARATQVSEPLIVNNHGRIAEAALSNIFLVKNSQLITPPLSEGCVDGVFRKVLLSNLSVVQAPVAPADLLEADELFFTNALHGIKWVRQFGDKTYERKIASDIYHEAVKTIWA